MEEINVKYFAPAEARKTLPLVGQIVGDILENGKKIRELTDNFIGIIDGNKEIEALSKKIEGYIGELEEIGCYYKDWNFEIGLVDFPGVIDGKEVFLCWRSDEKDILYYHGIEEGYSGRMRIPEDQSI